MSNKGRVVALALVCLALVAGSAAAQSWGPSAGGSTGVTAASVQNYLGLSRFNQQLAALWAAELAPKVSAAFVSQVQSFEGYFYDGGNTKVWVLDVISVAPNFSAAPGFLSLNLQEIKARVPRTGSWSATVKAKIKVKQKVGWFWVTVTFDATIWALNVNGTLKVTLNSSDAEAPKIAQVFPPVVNANVVIWTNQWYLNILSVILTPFMNEWLDDAIADAVEGIMPTLDGLAGLPGAWGTGGPALTDSGQPTNFLIPALKIADMIAQSHLPYGTLLHANHATPYYGTWEESLASPSFNPGPATGHGGYGDSTIWTGHYLTAESFRYKLTASPAALANIQTVLDGLLVCIQMKGPPGLLNRAVQPHSATPWEPTSPDRYIAAYQGVDYVMHDFISRDQYMGVFMGLAACFDLVNVPSAKAKAKAGIEMMLDYLLQNGWVAYRANGSISTVWHGNFAQQLAWVLAGRRVNPPKYATAYAQHMWLSDLSWFTVWTETFDPAKNSYYKFNLQHGAFWTALRIEVQPGVWVRLWKGLRVMRKALAHHQNAHFNMCEVGSNPVLASSPMGGETREALRRWLKRHRRDISANDPTIPAALYEPLSLGAMLGGAGGDLVDTEPPGMLAIHPVPIEKRPATDFLWQRGPFKLPAGGGSPHEQSPGVDYLLPYWMGRFYNVFPPP